MHGYTGFDHPQKWPGKVVPPWLDGFGIFYNLGFRRISDTKRVVSFRTALHFFVKKPLLITSRIQKGGALLPDMRALVCRWREKTGNLAPALFVREVLPKATQARSTDTYIRAFAPRFLLGSPKEAWKLCAALEERLPSPGIAVAFYYWITARAEPILYRFVTEELFEQSAAGIWTITSEETAIWIKRVTGELGKSWSDIVNLKTARAMLAALRDFGVLTGSARKHIAPAHLPLEAFCLIVFCLRECIGDSRNLPGHPDWRLFLLSPTAVDRLFLEAHQHGWLHYQSAGSTIRIEFPVSTFDDYVRLVLP